ncbi:unnamed protein product [Cuscuta campestris]|uniref:F-box associated beta-propeller type 3 domain-containing protein n=1 Tax=Cuscuta campestris TaxID=132261 RepID=A0A484LQB0_9ASTE|nr:unnamed protein product [Cuscuta campestris]
MFNILLCLSADVLYNVMRYVCRNWYDIIQSPAFIYAHLQHQKSRAAGFLFQRFNYSRPLVHVHLGEMSSDVELRQLAFPFRGFAVSTCNGLVWLLDYSGRRHSWLVNPVTKQHLALPPFDHFLDMKSYYLQKRNCSLGYAASSGVYKVVYYPPNSVACAIHTVGVDNNSWRPVSINISERGFTSSSSPYFYEPLTLGGFIYWLSNTLPFILSLNVETEIFKQISIQQLLPQTAFGYIPCFNLFCNGEFPYPCDDE